MNVHLGYWNRSIYHHMPLAFQELKYLWRQSSELLCEERKSCLVSIFQFYGNEGMFENLLVAFLHLLREIRTNNKQSVLFEIKIETIWQNFQRSFIKSISDTSLKTSFKLFSPVFYKLFENGHAAYALLFCLVFTSR